MDLRPAVARPVAMQPGQTVAGTSVAGCYGGYAVQLAKADGLCVIAGPARSTNPHAVGPRVRGTGRGRARGRRSQARIVEGVDGGSTELPLHPARSARRPISRRSRGSVLEHLLPKQRAPVRIRSPDPGYSLRIDYRVIFCSPSPGGERGAEVVRRLGDLQDPRAALMEQLIANADQPPTDPGMGLIDPASTVAPTSSSGTAATKSKKPSPLKFPGATPSLTSFVSVLPYGCRWLQFFNGLMDVDR